MIIEIKDMPPGRSIKDISINISFEDGEPVLNTELKAPDISIKEVDTFEKPNVPTPVGPIYADDRPKKEIPDEMKDISF